jgi:hypothetical protein
VRVASKVHNERRSIIDANALFERLVHAGDLEQSRGLVLHRRDTALHMRKGGNHSHRQKHCKLKGFTRFLVPHKIQPSIIVALRRFKNLVERGAIRKLTQLRMFTQLRATRPNQLTR